ncbi:MAG: thioether cross-link-forming SCIFF peptide maturase [Syntrophaceticus sp.]|nr:thioether cross-link-forming SCIFF peptide maturase [Syntrophaceticus sp.]
MRYSEELADLSSRVHLFVADGLHLAFDVNSGSLYDLDEVAWELVLYYLECGDWEEASLNTARRFGAREAADALAELQKLAAAGLFFSPGEEWPHYAPGKELGLKALCLNIAHECNLACKYCFVPENVRAQETIMSEETIKAALDLLLHETPYQNLTVDFFGGEPLLNFEGVKFAVEYALREGANKKWKFTVTTNTLLLGEEELSFFKEHDFSYVLSCDGRPWVHDAYRVTPGGCGTSQIVADRLRDFINAGAAPEYYVRGTFTRNNLDFTKDVLYLADLGAESISLEPVVASPGVPYALREEDLPELQAEYYRLARVLRQQERKGKGIAFYHYDLDLSGGPCVAKRLTGCGAGYQYLTVTPAGEIYPCHQLVGHQEYLMGHVDRGITAPQLQEKLQKAHIFKKKECTYCWARFLCGGGCHAQAVLNGGDLLHPYPPSCDIMRARLQGALYYQALQNNIVEEGDRQRPSA